VAVVSTALHVAVHAVLLLAVLAFMKIVIGHYVDLFRQLGAGLPKLARLAVNVFHVVTEYAFVVIPVLLLVDAGVCNVLRSRAERHWLWVWSIVFALSLIGFSATLLICLFLPPVL
jgi:type II secretory pathway component PulF